MNVTIHEILSLRKFNSFKLIAGVSGLDRKVARAGFIDHESPDEMAYIEFENEMIFSNLPMLIGKPEMIIEYVRSLFEANCACFAIKTTFFKSIPEEAIIFANKHNFPLFLFDDTYIEELILDIDECVNEQKQISKKVSLVEEMENNLLNTFTIKNYAYELNRHFYNNIIACFVKPTQNNMQNFDGKLVKKILGNAALVLSIQDSYLIVLSFAETGKIDLEDTLNVLGLRNGDYHVGISEMHNNLEAFDQIVFQSKTALKFACFQDCYISRFEEIGIYQLLFPLFDNYHAIRYHDTIIQKLTDHDHIHQSDLLETACAYIRCDGDIKTTATMMYQHSNTIRYRIRKIKSLIEFDKIKGMQYETLAIAIHLYELNKKRYTFSPL